MKKGLFLLLMAGIGSSAMAQTLTNYYDVYPGMSYTYRQITDISAIPEISTEGTNLTWDLSAIQLSPTLRTDSILTLQQSMFPNEFARATFVLKEPNGLQQFFRNSNDSIFYMGNSNNNTPSFLTPDIIIGNVEMPFNFDTGNQLTQNTTVGYSGQWAFRSSYKGFGTLLLPNGVSYPNIGLLIGQAGEANGSIQYYSYSFMRDFDRIPLVRIQLQSNGGPQFIQIAYVTENVNMEIGENTLANEIQIFPNPASNQLNITHALNKKVEVININGQVVYSQNSMAEVAVISIDDLAAGLYIIRLSDEKNIITKKLIKQ